MKELQIEARVENLDEVLTFVLDELDAQPVKLQALISTAVEEIFVNIASYAYHPNIGEAVIRLGLNGKVVIEFEDKGIPYNPLEKTDPDITLSAEERDIGGLGIFMVKNLMDSIEYRYENNKNILTISKVIV
jgi:anti-sigma regulatory factor (Ser/Thr protein kinase)